MTRRSRTTGLVTPITPGNMARRAAGTAMQGVISAFPGGRSAVLAYKAARTIQKAYRGYKARKAAPKKSSGPRRTVQYSGQYGGKFRRPSKKGGFSLAKKLGVVTSHELWGRVTDPDLVVVGHHTWPMSNVVNAINYAILRKLLKKAINFDASDINQEIPTENYNNAVGGRIEYVWKDAVTATIHVDAHVLINDDSIATVARTFFDSILGQFDNNVTWPTRELERVMFRSTVGGISVMADMNMVHEVIKLNVSTTIKIQNRTLAAGATTGDTDRVDAQPLQGRLLQFRGVPKSKNIALNNNLFSPIYKENSVTPDYSKSGVLLVRGAELGSSNIEPKTKQDWTNCYAQSNVRLAPGEIKTSKLNMSKGAYVNNLFKSIKAITGTSGTGSTSQSRQTAIPGFTQLFMFEELLNSGSTNNIWVQYEQQTYISCYLVTGRTPAINTNHTQSSYENV